MRRSCEDASSECMHVNGTAQAAAARRRLGGAPPLRPIPHDGSRVSPRHRRPPPGAARVAEARRRRRAPRVAVRRQGRPSSLEQAAARRHARAGGGGGFVVVVRVVARRALPPSPRRRRRKPAPSPPSSSSAAAASSMPTAPATGDGGGGGGGARRVARRGVASAEARRSSALVQRPGLQVHVDRGGRDRPPRGASSRAQQLAPPAQFAAPSCDHSSTRPSLASQVPGPGLFKWIGTEGGGRPWTNPATSGDVRLRRLENIFGNWIDLEDQARAAICQQPSRRQPSPRRPPLAHHHHLADARRPHPLLSGAGRVGASARVQLPSAVVAPRAAAAAGHPPPLLPPTHRRPGRGEVAGTPRKAHQPRQSTPAAAPRGRV